MRDTRSNNLFGKIGNQSNPSVHQNTAGQIINQNITINYFSNQHGPNQHQNMLAHQPQLLQNNGNSQRMNQLYNQNKMYLKNRGNPLE